MPFRTLQLVGLALSVMGAAPIFKFACRLGDSSSTSTVEVPSPSGVFRILAAILYDVNAMRGPSQSPSLLSSHSIAVGAAAHYDVTLTPIWCSSAAI